MDSSRESAEAACDILSQLVNCSLKTLRLISTARPSFMELPKVSRTNLRPPDQSGVFLCVLGNGLLNYQLKTLLSDSFHPLDLYLDSVERDH